MKRREVIALLGSVAVGLPVATRGQADATRRIGALIAFAKDDPISTSCDPQKPRHPRSASI
jgi:hypothetical protein